MGITITNKMMPEHSQQTSLAAVLQFITDSWPFVITFGAVWKGISEVAKIYSAKQEAKLRSLIKETVSDDFHALKVSIENLTDRIDKIGK